MEEESLDERERLAWLKLADMLVKTRSSVWGLVFGESYLGLCPAITELGLPMLLQNRMRERVEKFARENAARYTAAVGQPRFYWPVTVEGHEQRRQFCLEQASLLNPAQTRTDPVQMQIDEAVREAVRKEREACAALAEKLAIGVAAAIRAQQS